MVCFLPLKIIFFTKLIFIKYNFFFFWIWFEVFFKIFKLLKNILHHNSYIIVFYTYTELQIYSCFRSKVCHISFFQNSLQKIYSKSQAYYKKNYIFANYELSYLYNNKIFSWKPFLYRLMTVFLRYACACCNND